MADENKNEATEEESASEESSADEASVMCYISKKLVPISETVEVQYGAYKKYRVLPKYIRY